MVKLVTAKEIITVDIEEELKKSYLDYAMSVIVGRALPDARDGLKPVHRRVLYAMRELGNYWNKPYKKSARVVGDVIGKYHPHGDTAVYDTIVRMAQYFSLRYILIDGQGNFGSVDGDNAAAMRYTEIRMSKLAHELQVDLEKDTVDFVLNYDGTEKIPEVFPTKIPNLLINGSSGIAVGMATNIPPHNLGEVIDACLALIDNPEITIPELMSYLPGPDFPTYGIINGQAGIIEAYKTGRGIIYIRASVKIENISNSDRKQIIITELPYQLNKSRLIEKISELIKEKKIEGISELRDESDKDGMRVVIELKKGEIPEILINQLYSKTPMQSVFGINIVALINGHPKILNLKDMLEIFINHRKTVIIRRTLYDLRKARDRFHIIEGQTVALSNIKMLLNLIHNCSSFNDAKNCLLNTEWEVNDVLNCGFKNKKKYNLSLDQVKSILDLRLHKLTSIEHDKVRSEYKYIFNCINELENILINKNILINILSEELKSLKKEFNDKRRTKILLSKVDINTSDLIPTEDRVVIISHSGYAKTQPLKMYQAQKRGGKGKLATDVKHEDYIEHLLVVNSHTTLLLFSNIGKVYWLKTYDLPEASRIARGKPLINLIPLSNNERITTVLPIELNKNPSKNIYIVMATACGKIKKNVLETFLKPRNVGLIAIVLDEGDTLISAVLTNGNCDIMLFSEAGKVIRFKETDVRIMGRTAKGVIGMRLKKGQKLISMLIPEENSQILTASEYGYGKRTPVNEFPKYTRGGKGVIAMVSNNRNGKMIGSIQVLDIEEIMLISNKGTLVRTRVNEIASMSRNTKGITLIKLTSNETLVGLERIK